MIAKTKTRENVSDPLEILQKHWGHAAFRPLQAEIIQAVLDGRDALALLPTGGGKSVCFQVPALCLEGVCIVVSPLIALMKDQVEGLKKRGIPAAAVFSGMPLRELDRIFDNAVHGGYKFLYLSPERLQTDLAEARIERMNVSLLAIDEAHCISQWGYDFRPPYLKIAEIRQKMPKTPCLALTATATSEVVEDIQKRLDFKKGAAFFQQSFQRKNLSYSVLYESDKPKKLLDILRSVGGSSVVYCRSRGQTKDVAAFLQQNRVRAGFYHAGLTAEARAAAQDQWMSGQMRVIVATNAFGMGIDKPDVRTVIHLDLPDAPEAYFQEAGRAGRDGEKAFSVLLYEKNDAQKLRLQFETSFPDFETLKRVYQALGSYCQLAVGGGAGESFDFNLGEFSDRFQFNSLIAHNCLKILEQEGWIALSDAKANASTIRILVSREEFYSFQLKNKNYDRILQNLFRHYQGLHNSYQPINEWTIASQLKMPVEAVKTVFENMAKEGIVDYHAQKELPQLTFAHERVDSKNLTIDQKAFEFRKKRAFDRLESAIQYAEKLRCRPQQLLAYFGEKDAEPCGICDVCTGRNKPELTPEFFETYSRKIKQVIENEALGLDEILSAFAMKHHESVRQTLEFLLDEGRAEWIEGQKIRWKK